MTLGVRERLEPALDLRVLVVERADEPFQGQDAVPSGFLRRGEDLRNAALRELAEETGIDAPRLHLEQLATYGAPDRDPRGRVVSVAHLALAPDPPIPTAGSDAGSPRWTPVGKVHGKLAFDHDAVLDDGVERARRHLEYKVWGRRVDPRNFSRKVTSTPGFVEPTGAKRSPETGRPAALYRAGKETSLNPPILRSQTG